MRVDLTTLISRTLLLFCLFTAPLAGAQVPTAGFTFVTDEAKGELWKITPRGK